MKVLPDKRRHEIADKRKQAWLEVVEQLKEYAAIIAAFVSVFIFFFKLLFF
ncbi:hypothetical protein [Sediminibacterium ginsengisoli]|uniref:Uncharacterized protein n=1 Tax=Sediminibacterium ginsengisoli TaxID=413434 RepID=A0A1T4RME9_9BACT|nr:hypothetical protein [Sediminibacterium ginsengisoli]SKA17067.1 hypothetical protein SAMN04488132_11349 [Sediminibacterium ginsengisoli]